MSVYNELLRGFFQKGADDACVVSFSKDQLDSIVNLTPQYALTVGSIGLIGAACGHEVNAWGSNAELNSKSAIRSDVLFLLSTSTAEIYRDKSLRSAYDLYYVLLAAEFAGEGSLMYRGPKNSRDEAVVDASFDRLYRDRLVNDEARPVKGLYRFLAPALPAFFANKFNHSEDRSILVTQAATQSYLLKQDKYLIKKRVSI